MLHQIPNSTVASPGLVAFKSKQFFALLKFRLSLLVLFSGTIGYLMAWNGAAWSWGAFFWFVLGSFLITGAANTINQILEREVDKHMPRTRTRPLPTGALQVGETTAYAVTLAALGTLILVLGVNVGTASLALLSLILYAFVYTPLKGVTSFSVFVGAIPGALPPLIGWYAASGELSIGAFIVFGLQFAWQFPHFWAIAWLAHDDYMKVGYNLLPTGERDWGTALQIVSYTLFLIPLGLLPWWHGLTGPVSAIIVTLAGVLFLVPAIQLLRKEDRRSARMLMFGSFLYLPVMQIALVLDMLY